VCCECVVSFLCGAHLAPPQPLKRTITNDRVKEEPRYTLTHTHTRTLYETYTQDSILNTNTYIRVPRTCVS